MRRGYVDTPEGQVHFLTKGKGESLLLLHQNPRSSRMYEELVPFLAHKYHVIAMDTLGAGSSAPASVPFRIADLAQCVVHFLNALDVHQCHLFGLHTGAAIAGEVAAEWPGRVKGLILFGYPAAAPGPEREDALSQNPARAAQLVEPASDGTDVMRQWVTSYRQVNNMWSHAGVTPPRDFPPEILRFQHRYMMDVAQARQSAVAMYQAVFSYDWQDRVPLIQARTLLIEATSPSEPEYCRRGDKLIRMICNSAVTKMERGDANAAEFRPAELADIMLNFLSQGRR